MRLRLLSRASALAVLQADLVAQALRAADPSIEIVRMTRTSEGDRDRQFDLAAAADKGVFTTDLSRQLIEGRADAVVHSWKDLPIALHPGTRLAGTIARADPRDVLLVRRDVTADRPATITVLSSAPRRVWQIASSAPRLLPWTIAHVRTAPVRGNVPTRLNKLIAGEGDALIVAKAALDRLLSDDAPAAVRATIRRAIDACRWMVLPLKDHPTAPAQGALAIEIADGRDDLADLFGRIDDEPTRRAVDIEREILAGFGGGCHEAVGATVFEREYGRVTSVRARVPGLGERSTWSLEPVGDRPPSTTLDRLWPRPDERHRQRRHPIAIAQPDADAWWISRADAFPDSWTPRTDQIVWAAGGKTWERLARRGIWVHGCADGLGDAEPPAIDALADRAVAWTRLTHGGSMDPAAIATYSVDEELPADLADRTHFFWTSGTVFRRAMHLRPSMADAWHASGPGRTAATLREILPRSPRVSVWLDYDQWLQHVTS